MRLRRAAATLLIVGLAACAGPAPNPLPTRTQAVPAGTAALTLPVAPTIAPTVVASAVPAATLNQPIAETAYTSRDVPLTQRVDTSQAGLDSASPNSFVMHTGDFQLDLSSGPDSAIRLSRPGSLAALALRPFGRGLNGLSKVDQVMAVGVAGRPGILVAGSSAWMHYQLWLWVYPHNPGLLHYHLQVTRSGDLPAVDVEPEWTFVDPVTGAETAADYSAYADRSSFAAPSFYGYSAALGSTLLHWVDLTRLNPYISATGYSPANAPVRQGHKFGLDLSASDLRALPLGTTETVYDSYLYLVPGEPGDEAAMFLRYLQQAADIYDLIAHPVSAQTLPDWQALAQHTLADLQDPDTTVTLNGKRYWRAYVGDTRQSAEAITQLDVGLAVARYALRFANASATSGLTTRILADITAGLPDFYNPAYGLIQNSGPLAITGSQGRGDTWYELEHALKAAELGALGYETGRRLALDSQAAWIHYAHSVGYRFPRFYSFKTWTGTEREPDAAGGYALYMLRLEGLGCPPQSCRAEAQAAVAALSGYGFGLAYETHITAMAALAAVQLADETGDNHWLAQSYGPIANLVRLSWVYEVDYGAAPPANTFFGLSPTQRSGVISAKEQYEAWIYLTEFLRRAHGRIDPSVEKLVSELCWHTLVTLASSLPPRLPPGLATTHPAAYATVKTNRLDLYIPLEDMRDGRSEWGTIGQQIYGAGLAPTLAALAYAEPGPGLTAYSGYPLAAAANGRITLSGVHGTYAPVQVSGARHIVDGQGQPVGAVPCGAALCFQAEGGASYELQP